MSPLFREHRSCLCKADEHMENKRRHALSSTGSHQQCAAHLSSWRLCTGDSSFDVIWSSALSNLHPQEDLGIRRLTPREAHKPFPYDQSRRNDHSWKTVGTQPRTQIVKKTN